MLVHAVVLSLVNPNLKTGNLQKIIVERSEMAFCRSLWRFLLVLAVLCTVHIPVDGETDENETTEETTAETTAEQATTDETATASDEIKEEDDVLVLTKDNFDKALKDNDVILVEFYAPWCGHCKQLAPEYSKAAKTMKSTDPAVPFAKVDATVETDVASKFEIGGYPTLKIFRKGVPYEYDGPREEKGIVKYMKEQADPNWKPPPEAVVTLTKDNFDDVINNQDLMLVEFYAPWCGHCKRLAPEYEKAAKELQKDDPPIMLAKVDATVESELAKKYEVTGYPTLKVFRKGKPSDYTGDRSQYAIEGYMRSQVGPSSKLLSNLKAINDFIKQTDDLVILGLFDNDKEPLYETYLEANNDLRNEHSFGHTFDAAAKKRYGVDQSSIILIHPERFHSKFEDAFALFKGKDPKPEDLQAFYNNNLIPLVGQMNSWDKEKKYKKRPLCVVYYDVDFSFDNRKATQYWRKKVLEVANDHRDVTFAIASEQDFETDLKDLGLDESGEEVNVGCFDDKNRKYKMEPEDEFSEETLAEFIEDFKAGKIRAQIKSQPVPKKNTGPVRVVVGTTFDEIVMDPTKDVMIELYAPWCGHCKALEPTYKKLGKHFKDNDSVVIAKMDATNNDSPPKFSAEGFPTIYFAPANSKDKPIKYEGARELDDFVKFIAEKGSSEKKAATKEEL